MVVGHLKKIISTESEIPKPVPVPFPFRDPLFFPKLIFIFLLHTQIPTSVSLASETQGLFSFIPLVYLINFSMDAYLVLRDYDPSVKDLAVKLWSLENFRGQSPLLPGQMEPLISFSDISRI